ncbi:DUF4350 domain-containing protein [Hymenobacter amundsenii]|uniref:DUF4350 domain-containing protein n=1 Tax=Hymenobacter amundsenii TaxID=2006685 RepID=UPI000F82E0C3|nr:DUF4350 domain-containing protein [Hymenobacter amundsenii]
MTTFRWYLVGLGLLFAAYVAVEYYRPKPLDWSPTLRNDHKSPYGTFVLFDQLPTVLGVPAEEVRIVRAPIFSQIEGMDEDDFATGLDEEAESAATADSTNAATAAAEDSADTASFADTTASATAAAPATPGPTRPRQPATATDTAGEDADYAAGLAAGHFEPATYLFVAQSFRLSRLDCQALLRHVARGNDVLIAAEDFDSYFADTLGFQTSLSGKALELHTVRPDAVGQPAGDSVQLQLTNPTLARQAGAAFRLPPAPPSPACCPIRTSPAALPNSPPPPTMTKPCCCACPTAGATSIFARCRWRFPTTSCSSRAPATSPSRPSRTCPLAAPCGGTSTRSRAGGASSRCCGSCSTTRPCATPLTSRC